MEFHIESARELTEGLPPATVWRPGFPNRIVTARYKGAWKTDALFDQASRSEIVPIFLEFFKTLGFFEIAPTQEWPELGYDSAQHLVYRFVRQSQAYDIELRNSEDARSITTSIVPDMPHTRFFSNYDVVRTDEEIVNYISPGGQLTYHTFEFAIVTIRPNSIVLFLSCDED